MSKIKVYGNKFSRTPRITWCLQEVGADYEVIETPFDQLKTPEYLALNPNGKIPCLKDGDLTMFESLAINLYIAKTYGTGKIYPSNPAEEALVLQWTLWVATEVEPYLLAALLFKLGFSKDEHAASAAPERVKPAMQVLDKHLANRKWIVGETFSVADLNVAAVVSTTQHSGVDISYATNVTDWLARCLARAAG